MNSFQQWLAKKAFHYLSPYLSDLIAIPLSKRAEAVRFATKAIDGGTLRDCVREAFKTTAGDDEFAIADKIYNNTKKVLSTAFKVLDDRPFLNVIAQLEEIGIPDGDGDPTNDTNLAELVGDVLEEVARGNS